MNLCDLPFPEASWDAFVSFSLKELTVQNQHQEYVFREQTFKSCEEVNVATTARWWFRYNLAAASCGH